MFSPQFNYGENIGNLVCPAVQLLDDRSPYEGFKEKCFRCKGEKDVYSYGIRGFYC
jgi:hypothetical protein